MKNEGALMYGALAFVALAFQRYFIHERVSLRGIQNAQGQPRKILITGGASGIGRETAILFHSKGWEVGIADLNLVAAEALALELGQHRASPIKLDVTNPESCKQAIQTFVGENGALDALFNSAGLLEIGMFADMDLSKQTLQIRVNMEGIVNMTYSAVPALKAGKGVVVNMASSSAQAGIPMHAVYAATKAGVYSLTEAFSMEFHPMGVRAADISVGYVATPMLLDQKSKNTRMLHTPYMGAKAVAHTVWKAVHKARLHREHFYVEYSTAFIFKLQGFCRALGIRFAMKSVAFMCMPVS